MYIQEYNEYEIPLAWEVKLLEKTFAEMQTVFKRYTTVKKEKNLFDLEPHIKTIQENLFLEQRYRQLGFPARIFQPWLQDMVDALNQDNAKKIIACRKNVILVATWFANNPAPVSQGQMMIA